MKRDLQRVLFGAAGLCVLAVAAPALAQPAVGQPASPAPSEAVQTAPATQVGEVIVQARQRSEELQKVPAQVTAFTAQTIERKGVESPRDFLSAVPNVHLIEVQNAGTAFVVIRGISQARNSEPSVAVVVDGVPETQPAQFNQELFDIQQIEVIKGPQGALYGRNAIGGAILVTTKQPSDHWEGRFVAGIESGLGGKVQGSVSGPLTDVLGVRAGISYVNTAGHIENTFLHAKADPVSDLQGRLKFLYKPTDKFTADLRLSFDRLWTQGFYYNINYYNGLGFLGPPYSVLTTPDVNNTSLPVRVNNPGKDNRAIYDVSLKMDYDLGWGTLTSISAYNLTKEIITGDAFDFLPNGQSLLDIFAGFDQNQSQFLRVRTLTQEFRITSRSDQRFRWIAGGQLFGTKRFISTGNEWDTGNGVAPTFYSPTTPAPSFPGFTTNPNPQATFLSDHQDNFAWAIYLDTSTSITEQLELSLNVRYDHDHRKNTTDTPQAFLDAALIPALTGQVREASWDDWQPQAILKYQVNPDFSLYASWGRGFRSGGFNQTGVATAAAAAGFVGVGDQFNAEKAESWEGGFKSSLAGGRLRLNGAVFTTLSKNPYFFVFLASNSTQNLGNIPEVRYTGFDLDLTARLTDDFTVTAGYGYVDSSVKKYYAGYDFRLGQNAPTVMRDSINASAEWRPPVMDMGNALFRVDYSMLGRTYFWESDTVPAGTPTIISRDPVHLVDVRMGFEGHDWSVIGWVKNLLNEKYNSEYSPGGFVFKAQPIRFGVDVTRRF